MASSDTVQVGPVSTREGYRLHLAESGRAHCGSGRGRVLRTLALTPDYEPHLCRRCIRAIRVAVEHASAGAANAEANAYSDTAVQALSILADALTSVADHAADEARRDALAARIREGLLKSGVLVAREEPVYPAAPRNWAELREQYRRDLTSAA